MSSYTVARNDTNSSAAIGSTSDRSYTVAGLAPNTRYCFVIKNPITANTMSNTACATTQADSIAPTTPSGLSATAISPAEVALSWDLSSDNDRVAGYNIYRDGTLLKSSAAARTADKDAVANTTHCYTVIAFDPANNESAPSVESCAAIPEDTAIPSTPAGLSAAFSSDAPQAAIRLSWEAAIDDGLVKFYKVFRDGVYIADASSTAHDDVDLQPDTSHCYVVSAVDSVGKESGQSEPACARESWRSTTLDYLGVSSAIAIDSNDTPHIAFKGPSNDGIFRLRYLRLEDQQSVADVLEEGIDTFNFSDANLVTIAIDKEDSVHLAHKLNRDVFPEEIQHVEITSSSATAKSTIQQTDESMNSIALAIDSGGSQHACYGLSNRLIYGTNSSGTWLADDVSSLVPGIAGANCDIAIDANDNVHISFTEIGSRDLMYLSNQSGVWMAERLDAHSGTPISTSHETSIAADSEGKIHIAYFHDFADNDLEYATNASGSWTTRAIDQEGDVGFDCEVAVDSVGALHIVYRDLTNAPLLKYATNRFGIWETGFLSAAGIGDAAIAVDARDNVHVTFSGSDSLTYMTDADPEP